MDERDEARELADRILRRVAVDTFPPRPQGHRRMVDATRVERVVAVIVVLSLFALSVGLGIGIGVRL